MKSSCIQQPKNNHYIQVSAWQVQFCRGNHCAAFILSHFIAWHDWKLNHDEYYQRVNNIAEFHGDGRPHDQNAYLFFSMEEISEGILGAYGKNTIISALQLLEDLGAISVHKNPNPRYHFDKTKYFIFYPEVCNDWIEESYLNKAEVVEDDEEIAELTVQSVNNLDRLKVNDRSSKTKPPSSEIKLPSFKKGRAITETTNNTTQQDQSIKTHEPILTKTNLEKGRAESKPIIDALIAEGFPSKRFSFPDSMESIQRLLEAGATEEVFLEAYHKAELATGTAGFGVNYLAKVVEGLLAKQAISQMATAVTSTKKERVFENEIPDNVDWIDGGS